MTARSEDLPQSFEIQAYFSRSARQSRSLRFIAYYGIVAMIVLTLLFVPVTVVRLMAGDASPVEVGVTFAVVCFAGYISFNLWLAIRRHPSGSPDRLEILPSAFGLVWRDGSSVFLSWADPRLSFELDDYSGSDALSLVSPTKFGLRIRGVEYPIPEDAFHLLSKEASRRGVISPARRQRNILYRRGVVAVRYLVRAVLPGTTPVP